MQPIVDVNSRTIVRRVILKPTLHSPRASFVDLTSFDTSKNHTINGGVFGDDNNVFSKDILDTNHKGVSLSDNSGVSNGSLLNSIKQNETTPHHDIENELYKVYFNRNQNPTQLIDFIVCTTWIELNDGSYLISSRSLNNELDNFQYDNKYNRRFLNISGYLIQPRNILSVSDPFYEFDNSYECKVTSILHIL